MVLLTPRSSITNWRGEERRGCKVAFSEHTQKKGERERDNQREKERDYPRGSDTN